MPLSVVDLYRNVLPKTNCRDCGFATCLAFASMVVSERLPIAGCPHLDPAETARCQAILDEQQAGGKWVRKDPAREALAWARQRAASMRLEDLPRRIGGRLDELAAAAGGLGAAVHSAAAQGAGAAPFLGQPQG